MKVQFFSMLLFALGAVALWYPHNTIVSDLDGQEYYQGTCTTDFNKCYITYEQTYWRRSPELKKKVPAHRTIVKGVRCWQPYGSTVGFNRRDPPSTPVSVPPPEPCRRCRRRDRVTLLITRQSNRNNNAGRPYYKCRACDLFLAFADVRGDDPANPHCSCGLPARRQLSSREKGRRVHFVCGSGQCDFYSPCFDRDGIAVTVENDQLADLLERLCII
ncbi:hypothetical protein E4U41_004554 [Claviceps citrina]|nr:hypothetical protein E4U41_004554 [Claviceps citrina]